MANKVTNSKVAYFISDIASTKIHKRLITTDDALMYLNEGITLRDHLFDVKEFDRGNIVPLKFVSSVNRSNYFATKATTLSKGTHGNSSVLIDYAKSFMVGLGYAKIQMGVFKICNNFINSIEQDVIIKFFDVDKNNLVTINPDVVMYTQFQDIFVEFKTSSGVDLDTYKKYRRYGFHANAFSVFTIDLSDLSKSVELFGLTDEIRTKVKERILSNSEFKTMLPLISFNLSDAPFGWCKRTGLPYKLLINKAADTVCGNLAELLSTNTDIKTSIIYSDGLWERGSKAFYDNFNMLFLTDDSPEHPLRPLTCIVHDEEPLKLVMQAQGKGNNMGRVYIKCELNESSDSENSYGNVSLCSFTCDFCDKYGNISDEYLVLGDLSNLLLKNSTAFERILLYRKNIADFKSR